MIHIGDSRIILPTLPEKSVHCCVTSPPYFGLRDYGVDGQIGMEQTPEQFISEMVNVFREVRRVLRDDGTLWLNLGDSYASPTKWGGSTGGKHANGLHGNTGVGRQKRDYGDLKQKDLIGIPWMVAFALRADGWFLRCDIVWAKPNPMPESVKDRPTKAHEYIFLLSKSERYYYDAEAIKEPASDDLGLLRSKAIFTDNADPGCIPQHSPSIKKRILDKQRGHSPRHAGFNERWDAMEKSDQCSGMRNKRSVWEVATHPFSGAHFATFPPRLIEPCILAGCPAGGTVLDPFFGAGTTGVVCQANGRNFIGIELNPEYAQMADQRIKNAQIGFGFDYAEMAI